METQERWSNEGTRRYLPIFIDGNNRENLVGDARLVIKNKEKNIWLVQLNVIMGRTIEADNERHAKVLTLSHYKKLIKSEYERLFSEKKRNKGVN